MSCIGRYSIVLTVDAWLMTNGLDAGIVQLVGQALNKIRLTNSELVITAIAVAKFGCITNYSSLKKPTNQVRIYCIPYIV
jgi:hypothetical protein